MRLWTWQKASFSITDVQATVDTFGHSSHLKGPHVAEEDKQRFVGAYKELWKRVGTDQFHWCYTEEKEAKGAESYEGEGKALWEVDVPNEHEEQHVFQIVCSVAWCRILGDMSLPPKFCERPQLLRTLCDYWREESKGLWDRLILDKSVFLDKSLPFLETVEICGQVLLRHPVPEEWVSKNPQRMGRWWR
jgi:hypothetical protein